MYMIKKLLFIAALLVPNLACGANPSANLLVQVVPASSSPAVPAPAAAAGFTTLALNADFSQSIYSNIATWVDGCGGPNSGFRWVFQWFGGGGGAPCNHIVVENDPSIGKPVLHLKYFPSDNAGGTDSGAQIMVLTYPERGFASNNNFFPVEQYVEIAFRESAASLTQSHELNNFGPYNSSGPNHDNVLEPDFTEVLTNTNTGSGWTWSDGTLEWCGGTVCGGIFSLDNKQMDVTVYHTIGVLFTSNGTSNFAKCYFLDGTPLGCGGTGLHNPDILTQNDHIYTMGWGTDGGNLANGAITTNEDIYVQSVKIWECPGGFGTSTGCAGTVVDHWPFP